jgi:arylsulfatase
MSGSSRELQRRKSLLALLLSTALLAPAAYAQDSLPHPDSHFKGFVGSTYLDSDAATFPQPVRASRGAPNVLLVLFDDVGFGQFSVTGGGVSSPALENLAKEGLIYNRFHTTALCSPTRACPPTRRMNHGQSV